MKLTCSFICLAFLKIHVYIWGGHAFARAHMWRSGESLKCQLLPFTLFEMAFYSFLQASWLVSFWGHPSPHLHTPLCSRSTGVTDMHPCIQFFLGSGDLNPDVQTCTGKCFTHWVISIALFFLNTFHQLSYITVLSWMSLDDFNESIKMIQSLPFMCYVHCMNRFFRILTNTKLASYLKKQVHT